MSKTGSIQQKTQQLNELVAWFDGDDFTLEEALDMFKKAEIIATEIEKDLTSLKNDITIVKQKFDVESA